MSSERSIHADSITRKLAQIPAPIWSVILLSVLICGMLAWLRFQQRQTFADATEALISVREARIDLTKGFLYVSLAGGPASPFQREEGMALIGQALESFRHSLQVVGSPETDLAFHISIDIFQRRLAGWQRTGGHQAATETNLRIAFHDVERKADLLDMEVEQHLWQLSARQNREFTLALVVAALFLAAICLIVLRSEYARTQAEEILRNSEERLSLIIRNSPDLIFLLDKELHYVWVPKTAMVLSPKEVLGHTDHELFSPEEAARLDAINHQVMATGESIRYDMRLPSVDGELIYDNTALPWRDAEGRIIGIVVYAHDITTLKKAQEALQQSEAKYVAIFQSTPDTITLTRLPEATILDVNPGFTALTGYTAEEVRGKTFFELPLWVTPEERTTMHAQIIAQRELTNYEFRSKHKDGSIRYASISSRAMQLDGELCILGVTRDITARKQVEQALQEEKVFTDAIFNSVPGLLYVYSADGHLVRWNKKHEVITGYSAAELAQRHIYDWFAGEPEDLAVVRAGVERALRDGYAEAEARLITKGGTPIYFTFTAVLMTVHEQGYIVGIGIDITERKRAEEALRLKEFQLEESQRNAHIGTYVLDIPQHSWSNSAGLDDLFGIDADYPHTVDGWLRIVHPDDRDMMAHYFVEVAIPQRVFSKVYRIVRQNDGATRWVLGLGKVEYDQQGQPRQMLGTIQDITDRKLAEDERERLYEDNKAQRILFESIFRDAPVGIVLLHGPEHRFSLANPAYQRLVQGKGELIGRTIAEVFPEVASILVPLLNHVYHTGVPYFATDMPLTIMYDGVPQLAYYSFTYTPWRDVRGQIQGVLMIGDDTTAQVRARQDAEQERALLSTVLAALPVGIFILDVHGKFTHVNEAAKRIWGGNLPTVNSPEDYDQFVGWWPDSGTPIAPEEWASIRAIKSGEPIIGEVINIQRFDHTIGTILNSAVPLRDAKGNITGAVVVIQDISELRQTEETLSRERAFLASAIELLPLPIFFASTNEAIFRTNQACRQFLHEDGLDQWWAITMLDPNTHEPIAREDRGLSHLLKGEPAPPPREVTMRFPDGKEMPALLYMAPIALGKESIAAVIAFQDITSLKEADQAKNQFLKVISHELRTPLTSIIGWAKMLQEAPELMPEAVPIILQSAHQFEGLLERMIILSRILTGKLTARHETVNICTLADAVNREFQPLAERKSVNLLWQPPSQIPYTRGDSHLLQMALSELVDNAINFTPAGGRVTLICRATDDTVALSVTDTGRGITPEELPNVMKPFSQFRREESVGGIGIGLTLVQGIAHAHQGGVTVTSPGIDQGTTVTIELPLVKEESLPIK